MKRKWILDILLVFLFILVMDARYTTITAHEVLGTVLFLLFCLHHWWNIQWTKALPRGRWSAIRILSTVVNIILAIALIMVMVTGVAISRHISPFEGHAPHIWHALHAWSGYIMLIGIGLHIGLHGDGFLPRIRKWLGLTKTAIPQWIEKGTVLLLLAGGIYASFEYHIGMRLLMRHIKKIDRGPIDPWIFFPAHILIFALYAIIAYYLNRGLRKKNT